MPITAEEIEYQEMFQEFANNAFQEFIDWYTTNDCEEGCDFEGDKNIHGKLGENKFYTLETCGGRLFIYNTKHAALKLQWDMDSREGKKPYGYLGVSITNDEIKELECYFLGNKREFVRPKIREKIHMMVSKAKDYYPLNGMDLPEPEVMEKERFGEY